MKCSEQQNYLNWIEVEKTEPMKMFIENKGCQTFFCIKQTNNTEVNIQSLLQSEWTNCGPFRNFGILWLVSFDPKFTAWLVMFWLLMSVIRNIFCWSSLREYKWISLVNVVQIAGYNIFVLLLIFSFNQIQVVSYLLPLFEILTKFKIYRSRLKKLFF